MRYLLCLFFGILVSALYSQQVNNYYDAQWLQVYRLELKSLPKSALALVDEIYDHAIRDKDEAQMIKALIYQSKFALALEEDAELKVVNRFREKIAESKGASRAILENYLAAMYFDYYQRNSWQIHQRTKTVDPIETEDFRKWDAHALLAESNRLFQSSVKSFKTLKNNKLNDFNSIIFKQDSVDKYRPTLVDILAHQAIDFYKTGYSGYYIRKAYPLRLTQAYFQSLETLELPNSPDSIPQLEALSLYQKLYRYHKDRKDLHALVKVDLERLDYVKDYGNQSGYLEALNRLETLAKDHPAITLVQFAEATWYNQYNDKPKALEICRQAISNYPESDGARYCLTLKEHIEAHELSILTEEYLVPEKPFRLLVNYKGFNHLYVKTYQLNKAQSKEFNHSNDSTKKVLMDQWPVKQEVNYQLPDQKDYNNHSTEVAISGLPAGSYLLVASTEEKLKENLYAYTMVQVTNVALVTLIPDHQQIRFQAVNRYTGAPLVGRQIRIYEKSTEQVNREPFDKTLQTDQHGFVYLDRPDFYLHATAEVIDEKDSATFDHVYVYRGYEESRNQEETVNARAFLFTDRSIYRPGQTLYFKGIVLKKSNTETSTLPNEYVNVKLEDVNGEEVGSLTLKTNAYGSVSGEFQLPKQGLTGQYSLTLEEDYEMDSQFYDDVMDNFEPAYLNISVEEYKRPTFEVTFDPVKETFKLNDTITISGKATSFSGAAISQAKVTFFVERSEIYQPYYSRGTYDYSYPNFGSNTEIHSGETITDDQGSYEITFKALADDSGPYNFQVTATVTDINGETHDAYTSVKVANIELEATLKVSDQVDVQHLKEEKITYQVTNLNGEPRITTGEITIYQLKAPDQNPIRPSPWGAPDSPIIPKEEFKKLFPHEGDRFHENSHWTEWERGEVVKVFQFEGSDGAFVLPKLTHGAYIVELNTLDPSGNEITALAFFKAFDSKTPKLLGNALIDVQPDKRKYQIGEQAQLAVGTASEDLTVILNIFRKDQPLETRLLHLSNEVKILSIEVKPEDADGLVVDYYCVNYNSYQRNTLRIDVQQPEREQFKIETLTFRDKIMPGSEETWSFRLKGNKKEQAEVEVLASMYDVSLDQFLPHKWSINPFPKQSFHHYSNYNFEGFGNSNFTIKNQKNRYYQAPFYRHSKLNWFGFSLADKRANQDYLNRLRIHSELFQNTVHFSNDSSRANGYVYGIVKSQEDGLPLPGVNVVIKGTSKGTTSNENGQYTMACKSGDVLVYSFVGYQKEEVSIQNANVIDIDLAPAYENLAEVVVVGYGVVKKQSLTGSVVQVTEETVIEEIVFEEAPEEEAVLEAVAFDQVAVRGLSAQPNENMLYVVDGVVVSASDFSEDEVASMEVLKGPQATALYGARAANGVVIIQTKAGQQKLNQLLSEVKARKDLRETAFFYPHLRTSKKGDISFTFNTPEALTQWKLQLLAHNRELKTGYKSLKAVTQKELMVVPNTPRFLRHGDRIVLTTKVVNLTDQTQQTQVAITLYDALTNQEITPALISENNTSITIPAMGSETTSWYLEVPESYDALNIKVVATNGTYSDGEQRVVPVLSNRQLVTESMPMVVKGGSTKTFEMEKLSKNQSSTLQHQRVTLEMTPNPIWEVVKALPYLMDYPYACSEQTFSRLYANLLAQQIIRENEEIKNVFDQWQSSEVLISNLEKNEELKSLILRETPWLRDAASEAQQHKRIALLFDLNKSAEQAAATLEHLQRKQLSNGAFSWFAEVPNRYITQYILAGFAHLNRLGIEPYGDAYETMVSKAIRYLDQQIMEDYDGLKLEESKQTDTNKHLTDLQVQYLYARSYFDQNISDDLQTIIDYYTKQSVTYWADLGLMSQAMVALTHYHNGKMDQANEMIQSLDENSIVSEDKGMYWKANTGGYYWYQSPIETHAILLEAFQEIMSDTDERKNTIVNEMKNWLIQHKHSNNWKTTKATTEAIFAMLLNTTLTELEESPVEAVIDNQSLKPTNTEAGTGYFKRQWLGDEITSGLGQVTITNAAETMTYGSLTWQYLEEFDKITSAATGAVKLTKGVFKVARDQQGEVLKTVNETTPLATGDLLRVRITLQADRALEYVHMKDQRAAGLEPVSTLSSYHWQEGLGYYQSTKDASTDFFFDRVTKGVYVFEYDLRVNNQGSFTNGLTTIQCMYAPEYNSHSESIRLKVSE